MKTVRRAKRGFTLVELSFAIAFISVLLITVTLITNEIVSIYRKGYSIKSVNQVGRDLIDDFQSSLIESPPSSFASFCSLKYSDGSTSRGHCDGENGNNGFYSVYQQFYKTGVYILNNDEDTARTVPIGGIFCSGKYTYVWNSGYLFNDDGYYYTNDGKSLSDPNFVSTGQGLRLSVKYKLVGASGETTKKDFRLLKIEDTSRNVCATTLTTDYGYPDPGAILETPGNSHSREIDITNTPLSKEPEEMLNETDTSLAIYDLVIFQPARVTTTDRLLFSGSFILGTTTGGVDIMTTSNFCKAPTNFSADFNYCAINKFNFTVQASGGE